MGKMDHRLISFDGTSGTGKSTICRLTKDYLVEKGYDCQIIKFPSGHLRDLIQDERYSETRDPFLESYLFAASFRGLIVRNVIPVKDQTIFLFDRSYITSYVDSNYGSNNIENIIEINKYNPKFDLSFILGGLPLPKTGALAALIKLNSFFNLLITVGDSMLPTE